MSIIKELKSSTGYVEIVERGRQGSRGEPGDLEGTGTLGQVLTMQSDEVGDFAWDDPTFTGVASAITATDPDGNPSNVQTELDRDFTDEEMDNLTISEDLEVAGNIEAGSVLNYIKESVASGDEGINIEGELHVGTPDNPKESCFGGGDSTTEGMMVLTTTDNAEFVDLTDVASNTSEDFGLFNGSVAVGTSTYIGSDLPLKGIKVTCNNTSYPITGYVVREYWNGTAWTLFETCVTDANPPYTQRGRLIASVNGAEQVRFGDMSDQAEISIDGNTKYWFRFRITETLSTDGIYTQIKMHTSRYEINSDGVTEYFGDAIYEKDLNMHWHLTEDVEGLSPSNENIDFAQDMSLVYNDNEFTSSGTDGRGGYIIMPEGIDTSKKVKIELLWHPMDNNAGNILCRCNTAQIVVGETLDGSITSEQNETLLPVIAGSDNVLQKTTLSVDVEQLLPGELLVFTIKRIGNDSSDTYGGSLAMVNIRAIGYFWRP